MNSQYPFMQYLSRQDLQGFITCFKQYCEQYGINEAVDIVTQLLLQVIAQQYSTIKQVNPIYYQAFSNILQRTLDNQQCQYQVMKVFQRYNDTQKSPQAIKVISQQLIANQMKNVGVQLDRILPILVTKALKHQFSQQQLLEYKQSNDKLVTQVLQIYLTEYENQPARADHPLLQLFAKYGYLLSQSEECMKEIFSKHQQISHQFVGQLLQFLVETRQLQEMKNNQYTVASIAQSLMINLTEIKDSHSLSWDIQCIFKTLKKCYAAFSFNLIESLHYVSFINSNYFNPLDFIWVLFNAQFGLNEGVRSCYCMKCAQQQSEFRIMQAACDMNNKILPNTRLNLVIGLILLTNLIVVDSQKTIFDQLNQSSPSQQTLSKYYSYSRSLFYLNFSIGSIGLVSSEGFKDDIYKDDQSVFCPLHYLYNQVGLYFKNFLTKLENKQCQINIPPIRFDQIGTILQQPNIINNMSFVWRNVSFVATLFSLHTYFPKAIQMFLYTQSVDVENFSKLESFKSCYYKDPVTLCPEQFASTVSKVENIKQNLSYASLGKVLASLSLSQMIIKQNKQINIKVLEFIYRNNAELLAFIFYSIWMQQPSYAGKILDQVQDIVLINGKNLRCLQDCLFYSDNFMYSLDIACLAVGRKLINFPLYFHGQVLQNGFLFIEAVCVFLIKKICKFQLAVDPGFDYNKYQDFVTTDTIVVQNCSFHELIILSEQQQLTQYSEEKYKYIRISDSNIVESFVVQLFHLLLSYVPFVESGCRNERLKTKLKKLIETAKTCCESNYPNCRVVDKQEDDQIVMKDARSLIFKLLAKDITQEKFIEELENKYKSSEIQSQQRQIYLCVVKILIECLQNHEYIYELFNLSMSSVDDMARVAFYIIDIATVMGNLLAGGILNQDVFLPKLLKIVFDSLFIDQFDKRTTAKNVLIQFCSQLQKLNQQSEIINFINPQEWFSLFDIFVSHKQLKQLFDNQKGAYEYCLQMSKKCIYSMEVLGQKVENTNPQSNEIYFLLTQLDRLLRRSIFDEDISKFIKNNSNMLFQLLPEKIQIGNVQELIREKIGVCFNEKYCDIYTFLNDSSFIQVLDRDIQQSVSYFVYNILELTSVFAISNCFTFLMKWNNLDVPAMTLQYSLLLILRLLYVPQNFTITQEQLLQRRKYAYNLGQWIALLLFRQPIKGVDNREIDFICLIDLAVQCGTMSVISIFIQSFISATCHKTDYMPGTCGFYTVILQYLTERMEQIYCDDVQSDVIDDINPTACNKTKIIQDINKSQSVMNREFSDNLMQLGIIPNTIKLKFPQNFLSDYNLAILQQSVHHSQVPLNLTYKFVYENPNLYQLLVITQQLQKSESIFEIALTRIMEQARDTSFTLLNKMLPNFNPEKDEKHKLYIQRFMDKLSCSVLRSQFLAPTADNIMKELFKVVTFDNIPDAIMELVTNTILRQLCFIASEAVISNLQQQAHQFARMQYMKKDPNQQLKLADVEGLQNDERETPFGEEQSQPDSQAHNSNLQSDIDRIIDAFSPKQTSILQETKLQYKPTKYHRNISIFPFVAADPYFEIIQEPQQVQINNSDYGARYPTFKKFIKLDQVISVENYIQDYTKGKNILTKQLIQGYMHNQEIIYEQVQSMIENDFDSSLYKIFKNIINQQNNIVQNSSKAPNISLYNMNQTHKLNSSLHALRQLCVNNSQKLSFLEPLYKLALSSVSCLIDTTISQQQFKPEMQLQQIVNVFETKFQQFIVDDLKQAFAQQQEKYGDLFIQSLHDNRRSVSLFENEQQLCSHLTSASFGYFGIYSSLPLAIVATILQIYQDTRSNQNEIELKQYCLKVFQQTFQSALVFDITTPSPDSYWISDCVYSLIKGFLIFEIVSPTDLDNIIHTVLANINQQFQNLFKQFSPQLEAFVCSCKCVVNVLARVLSEIYFDVGEKIILKKQLKLNDFSHTIQFIQEFYIQSLESQVALVEKTDHKQFLITAKTVPLWVTSFLNLLYYSSPQNSIYDVVVHHSFSLLYSNYVVSQAKYITDRIQYLDNQATQFTESICQASSQIYAENVKKCFDDFCQLVPNISQTVDRQVSDAILHSHLKQIIIISGCLLSDQQAAKFADTLIFSTFMTQLSCFQDSEISVTQQQLFIIDCLARVFNFLIEEIPESKFQPEPSVQMEKPRLLSLILQRVSVFLSLFGSPFVSSADKLLVLKDYQNIDMSGKSVRFSETICRGQVDELYTNYSNQFVQRFLYTLSRDVLAPLDNQRQFFQPVYVEIFSGFYFQLRPQVFTTFTTNLISLVSEPTFLKACLQMQFSGIREQKVNIFISRSMLMNQKNRCWMVFHRLFKEVLAFGNLYSKEKIVNKKQSPLQRYYLYTIRLCCILSKSYPEYMRFYRLSLLSQTSASATQLKNAILSAQTEPSPPISDDVSGMLSLSATSFQENLDRKVLAESYKPMYDALHSLTDVLKPEAAHSIVQCFTSLAIQDQMNRVADFDFIHSFIYYVMTHSIVNQHSKGQDLWKTVGAEILTYIVRDCQIDYLWQAVIIGLSHFVGQPSQETYICASLLLHFGNMQQLNVSQFVKKMASDRFFAKPVPWGMEVLYKALFKGRYK